MPPEILKESGLVYSSVHDFPARFVWSPDSRNIALIDCLLDYGFATILRKRSMKEVVRKRTGAVWQLS
jgi:hypothetical protein